MRTTIIALLASFTVIFPSGAINITTPGSTYSQNFDSLATTGTSVAWANDSTISGWSLFNSSSAAITTYAANDGGANSGSFYSYGSGGNADRALGGLASGGAYFGSPASGAVAGWIAVAFENATGGTLNSFTSTWNGEQWRNGGNSFAQNMVFEYGFGASFGAVSTWVSPGANFNWTSPVATSTAAAVDGNQAGLVGGLGGTVSSLTWSAGDTLWLRWIERNDTGNDHGLAIDDFSFAAQRATTPPLPEGGSSALLLSISLLGLLLGRGLNIRPELAVVPSASRIRLPNS